jgi:hypothetical protein
LLKERSSFWENRTEIAWLQALVQRLRATMVGGKVTYVLNGNGLCRLAYAHALGISRKKLDKAVALVREGRVVLMNRTLRSGLIGSQAKDVVPFLVCLLAPSISPGSSLTSPLHTFFSCFFVGWSLC